MEACSSERRDATSDLAAAALPAVGVLDLLRFHHLHDLAPHGSRLRESDDSEQFAQALRTRRCTISARNQLPGELVTHQRIMTIASYRCTVTS